MIRSQLALPLLAVAGLIATSCSSNPSVQTAPGAPGSAAVTGPLRAIRREIPITGMIRRAYTAGTRDSTGRPGPKYWQTSVDYKIDARLDPGTSVVTGHEAIVLRNNGTEAMQNIVLRLDQNIFTANATRVSPVPEITDGMQVTKLVLNGRNVDLNTPVARGRGFPPQVVTEPTAISFNATSARVQLDTASRVAPKSSATLEIEWNFRVPKVESGRGLRMGRMADTLYQVGQWYPRVAVFDDYKGWDTDPYLGNAEFYNNFGHFEVNYDVPAGWLVGSTGVLQNPEQVLTATARARLSHALDADSPVVHVVTAAESGPGKSTAAGDRLVWRFVADSVADVAWATSKSYVWDATRATIPGKGAIPINIFYLPGHASGYERVGPSTRHAVQFYSRLWMPYAFPRLTVTDGPELGMEYPMFIMSGLQAADHETGHEWWPMMVGVNETWWGFMDEGFNQYMNILSANDANACSATKAAPCRTPLQGIDGAGQQYGRIQGTELEPPLMWDENYAGPLYSFAAYGKAPMMLSMLGGVVGDTAVWKAMSDYAHAWRFKHPTPWDYANFMSNALHQDLGWFWYYWLFTTEGVNGSIQNVLVNGEHVSVTVRQDGEMPAPVVLKMQFAAAGPKIEEMAGAMMMDSVTAVVKYPVDVWFNGGRTFTARLNFGGRAIEKITLDPFGRFPDRDVTDNVWPRK